MLKHKNLHINAAISTLTAAALYLSISTAAIAARAGDPALDELNLHADTSMYSETTGAFTAEGRVTAKIGDMSVTADKAIVRPASGTIEIPGGVTFTRGKETFKGGALTYNYKENKGSLQKAVGCFGGVNVSGESLDFSSGTLTFNKAIATTCGLDAMDYHVAARSVEINQTGHVKFKGLGFYLRNRRLLRLGSLSTSINGAGSGEAGAPGAAKPEKKRYAGFKLSPPSIGYAAIGGLNVRAGLYRQIAKDVTLRFRTSHYFSEGTFPEVEAVHNTGRALYRLRYGKQYKENTGYSRYTGPVSVWNRPMAEVEFGSRLLPGTRLLYSVEAAAGRMREKHNSRDISRVFSKVFLRYPLNPGKPVTVSLLGEGRYGVYSGWKKYSVLGSGAGLAAKLRDRHRINLEYLHFQDTGRTFFFSDLVNTHDRLFFTTSSKISGRTFARIDGEYDIDDNKTIEVEYGISKTYNCIRLDLGWRKELQSIMFRVNISGLDGRKN